MTNLKTSATIAASAAFFALASLASAAPTPAPMMADSNVHCYGVNSCKGTSDCKTAHNDCKGQNTCKGQGFKEMTTKACAAAGGTTSEKK